MRRGRIVQPAFFDRPAARVARDLLGKQLVRRMGKTVVSSMIMETEAYEGPHDLACHAARGRTTRTETMFGPPGTLYVYLIYGIHWMLNVVTCESGFPAAVLIRGVESTSGPGRLTSALGVDRNLNGKLACQRTGLWFEDVGRVIAPPSIMRTPRVGVDYAGPIWSVRKLRFVLSKGAIAS